MRLYKMSDGTGTNLAVADACLLDDACDEGDCQIPVPKRRAKRIKYVFCEHCLRDVSEKTYRNHCDLHFPCRDRGRRVDDDQRMMQENADPGMLLYIL